MNWNKLHTSFYQKTELYEMLWEGMTFSQFRCVGAPFGGPIAVIRDERSALLLGYGKGGNEGVNQPRMRIFSCAGKEISSFTWHHSGLVSMGWNSKEQLVCVLATGTVLIYSIRAQRLNSFELGQQCRQDTVADAIIYPTGLVARTGGGSALFAVTDFDNPVPFKLASPGLDKPPTTMAVIPPAGDSLFPEVLLGTHSGSIVVADRKEATDMLVDNAQGPFAIMKVSPDGTKIACFNDEGTLYIMTTDFTRNLSEFATQSKVPPFAMEWCGTEAIVLYWDKILLLVGFYGNFVKYSYDSPLLLVPECDGVRVVSEEKCEFLHKVPASTKAVFMSNSNEPGALLYDAFYAYEQKKVSADEYITTLQDGDKVEDAIDQCVDAALHAFSPKHQRNLLKAAYFGKLFADDYPSDQHVDQAKILRVLNAVRFYEVGIPLTYAQFQRLEAQVVINRLTARHHHLLALRISQYLNIPEDKVLVHWASAKIIAAEDEDDMTLANAVVAKLSKCSTVSFAAVAGIAARTGRRKLAIRLLEYETKASKQVPSLLAMHEHALALQKAIDSGDTDLISIVLLQMEARAESKAETKFEFKQFVTLIESKPIAWSIYTNYLKTQGQMQRLERLYGINEALHRVEAANVAILQAYRYKNFQDRFQLFGFAQEFYESSKKASFAANATKEHILLMKVQMKAAREHKDVSFLDASVSDILAKFIAMGKEKDALAIRRQFNVPDKRFWHIKVRTLARYDVNELRSLFEGGSNPIGVQPFIEACQEFGHKKEAVHFIKKIKHPLERMDALCNAGEWSDAAKVAVGERNRQALEMIAARCRMPEVVAYINEQIDSGAV